MTARGPYSKGLAKREEILDAAHRLLDELGVDRVSAREVAREAGISHSGMLHHFATKEELFLELLRRRDGRDVRPDHTRAVRTIGRLLDTLEENMLEPALVRLFVSMSAESVEEASPAHEFFRNRYRWLRRELAEDVAVDQVHGAIDGDLDPVLVATWLIALSDGLQLQWLLEPDEIDMSGTVGSWLATVQRERAPRRVRGRPRLRAARAARSR